MLRIAVPTEGKGGLESRVSDHFGRCETYTLLDEGGNVIEVIENTSRHMGGSGLPPELIKKHSVDVLLCKGIGHKAISMFEQLGIDVYVCQAETVGDIFNLWKNKQLGKAGPGDACKSERE